MNEEMTFQPAPRKPGLSTGVKVAIGCVVTALLVILVCGGIMFFVVRHFLSEAREFAQSFEQQGYTSISGQVIEVTTPVDQPTVYFGQVVNFRAPVNADVAIVAQSADVYSVIDGNVDFYGQVLTIHAGGVVTGDVRIKLAQAVSVQGTVGGEISGKAQQVIHPTSPGPTVAPPRPPDGGDGEAGMDAIGDDGEDG